MKYYRKRSPVEKEALGRGFLVAWITNSIFWGWLVARNSGFDFRNRRLK